MEKTQNVLNRMKKAFKEGRGIRISCDELKEMSLTFFGELWSQPDPRHLTTNAADTKERAADRGC